MFKINNNDFKILQKYKLFLIDLDNALENIPRKDMFYRDKIKETVLTLLDLILVASYSDKQDYFSKIKARISLIDFELERLTIKKYISLKVLEKLGLQLVEINKMVTGWLNYGSTN